MSDASDAHDVNDASAGCPDLAALSLGVGADAPPPELARHLAACVACRERRAQLESDESLLAEAAAALAPPPASGSAPHPSIDGYELLEEAGRGGQGVVYAARQLATGRKVALKVLLEGEHASARQLRRFEREFAAVVALRHPNVVTLLDGGRTRAGQPYLVMEWIDGVSLDRWMARRRADGLAPRAAVDFFQKLVEAIHHAHQRGVLHRDLKPGNVLVDAAGEPRVVDFGLAKALATEGNAAPAAEATRPGFFVGTLAYAAPEQLRGGADAVDVRADVWALGVLLHELLLGAPPHRSGESLAAAVQAVLEGELAFPRGFDDELAAILRRALAKERERRYPTALDLGRDLERWRRGEAVEARRGSFGYALRAFVRRHRIEVAAAALLLAVVVVAAAFSLRSWQRALRDADRRARIDGFVQRMFSALDPELARGRVVSVREVLEAAAAELDGERIDDAEVEAELRQTIGRACTSVGEDAAARRHFERALALLGAAVPSVAQAHHPGIAAALAGAGNAAFHCGDLARAEQLGRVVLAAVESAPRPDPERHAVALKNLAQVLAAKGEHAAAEPLLRRAVELWRAIGTGDEIVRSLNELGRVLVESGQLDEAEQRLREALATSLAQPGAALLKRAETHFELAGLADARGDLAAARDGFAQAGQLWRELLGESSASALLAAAEELFARQRLEGSGAVEEARRELVERVPPFEGRADFAVARLRGALGVLALAAGDVAAAESALRDSVALHEQLVGAKEVAAAIAQMNLGAALRMRGRPAEGARWAAAAVAALRDHGGVDPLLSGALVQLAWCEAERGELVAARAAAIEAVESLTALAEPTAAERERALEAALVQGWTLHLAGERAEAEEALAAVLEATVDGARRADLRARALRMAAEVARARGDFGVAEARYRAALELRTARAGQDDLELALAQDNFGWFLIERRRMAEARPLLEAALATRHARLGPAHPLLAWSLNNVGACHFFSGDGEAALRGFEEAVAVGRQAVAADDPALGTWVGNLAALRFKRGELDLAEPLLLEARRIVVGRRGEGDLEAKRLAGTLAALYRQRGDTARAAEFAAAAVER